MLYASCDAEEDIVGAVNDDKNIKQLLNLRTIFLVDVKVVLYLLVSRDSCSCFPISHHGQLCCKCSGMSVEWPSVVRLLVSLFWNTICY